MGAYDQVCTSLNIKNKNKITKTKEKTKINKNIANNKTKNKKEI